VDKREGTEQFESTRCERGVKEKRRLAAAVHKLCYQRHAGWDGPCGLALCCRSYYRFCVLSDEQLGPEQAQALRRMSPAERWRVAHRLYWTMRRHKAAFLRTEHPDWSDQQIGDQVRRIFLHAGT